MPIIFRPSVAVVTGWTEIGAGTIGTISWGATWEGRTAVEITRTVGSNGWNDLGIQRAWPSTGVGYVFYFVWFYPGNGTDQEYCLNDASGLAINSSVGDYSAGSGNVFLIYNGSTAGPQNPSVSGPYQGRFIVESDGNITFSWRANSLDSWTDVGTSTGIDYSTGTVYFQTNLFTDTKVGRVAEIALTDDGDLEPPAPGNPTAVATSDSAITIDWLDGTVTTTNADGISIERSLSSGSGFSEIDTVSVGDETFDDSGLDPATTYYYRLRAFVDWDGDTYYSAYTSETSATTDSPPDDDGDGGADMLALGEL